MSAASEAIASDALGVWVRGSLTCGSDGYYVWSGVWAMNEAQLLAGATSQFSYKSTTPRGLAPPCYAVGPSDDGVTLLPILAHARKDDRVLVHRASGAFTGSFDLKTATGALVTVDDPDFRLMLTAPLPSSGEGASPSSEMGGGIASWKVAGGGVNQYGQFVVLGQWTVADSLMEVWKGYLTTKLVKKRKVAKPKAARAAKPAAEEPPLPVLKGTVVGTATELVWSGNWGYGEKAFAPVAEGATSQLSSFAYTRSLAAAAAPPAPPAAAAPAAALEGAAAGEGATAAAAAPAVPTAPTSPAPTIDFAVPSTLSGAYIGYFHVANADATKPPTRIEEADLVMTFDAPAAAPSPAAAASASAPAGAGAAAAAAPLPEGVVAVHGVGSNPYGIFTFVGTYTVATREISCAKLYQIKAKPKKKPRAPKAARAKGRVSRGSSAASGSSTQSGSGRGSGRGSGVGSFSSFLKPTPRSTGRKRVLPAFMRDQQAEALEKKVGRGVGRCLLLLDRVEKHELSAPFRLPVDRALVPNYDKIVKRPIDISFIKAKLEGGGYSRPELFGQDMELMWTNALTYNVEGTQMHGLTQSLRTLFNKWYAKLEATLISEVPKPKPPPMPKVPKEAKKRKSGAAKRKKSQAAAPRSRPSSKPARKRQRKNRAADDVSDSEKSRLEREVEELKARLEAIESAALGGGGGFSSRKKSKPKPKKSAAKGVSFDEKRKLSREINRLPGDKLTKVLQIITERMPIDQQGDEIEVDIDQLDNETLRELQKYVKRVFAQDKAKARRERERSDQSVDPRALAQHANRAAAATQEQIDRLERELGGGPGFAFDGAGANSDGAEDLLNGMGMDAYY